MDTGSSFLNNLMNSGLLGMGYQSATGNPMFSAQRQAQGNMQSANQLGSPSFQSVPKAQGNWFTGYQPSIMTSSPYTSNQQNMMNMVGNIGMRGLQTGQMPGGMSFDPIRQQAITQFNTQTVPSLAERFTSMGGGQRSSAFQGALGQAGAGLNENLAGMQSQYQMQMLPMLMQMLGIGLKPQYEQQLIPAQGGFGQQLGSAAAAALPYMPLLFL